MEIIERREALAKGLPRYFTGKPCKSGHICERISKTRKCVECRRLWNKTDINRNRDRVNYYARKWRSENIYLFRERENTTSGKAAQRIVDLFSRMCESQRVRFAKWLLEVPHGRTITRACSYHAVDEYLADYSNY